MDFSTGNPKLAGSYPRRADPLILHITVDKTPITLVKFVLHRLVSAALLGRKRICQFHICALNLFIENILLTHITEFSVCTSLCRFTILISRCKAKQENKKQVTITDSKRYAQTYT